VGEGLKLDGVLLTMSHPCGVTLLTEQGNKVTVTLTVADSLRVASLLAEIVRTTNG
jgi:hypothetical protein